MGETASLRTLVALLQSGRARPVVKPERLAPSAIYDVDYRMVVVASTFEIHAKPYALSQRRIRADKLKLLQFVAFRPWLIPVIRDWSESQGYAQQSMLSPRELQRGFLGDEMHENVVEYLVARGVLFRFGVHLVTGANATLLERLYSTAVHNELFLAAIGALRELSEIRITNNMLEGW